MLDQNLAVEASCSSEITAEEVDVVCLLQYELMRRHILVVADGSSLGSTDLMASAKRSRWCLRSSALNSLRYSRHWAFAGASAFSILAAFAGLFEWNSFERALPSL